jgi:HPt (histidine-containing phosphotransfer) domain-containing protein
MEGIMATAVALQSEEPLDQGFSPSSQGERPVDLVHLSRFTLGDEKLEREVLQLFRVQTGIYLNRLESAADRESWCHAAHTIKGSAKGVGAWAVAAAAQSAEQLADAPEGYRAEAALKELKSAADAAMGFIDALFAER